MASAAIGGSHLVASTQAGALYGWQLALIIVLTNLFKYPFFRFSAHYTLDSGKSLIEGYAEKSRAYLWVFLVMCFLSSTISAAAVALLTAVIVQTALPGLPLSVNMWSVLLIASCVFILFMGRYKALDTLSKIIVVSLSITTVIAAGIAASKGMQIKADFVEPSPWMLAALPFIIALMGWMPAPIEISAINSLWLTAKQRYNPANYRDGMFDFNVGFITSAVLALFFLALGAFVQYGNGEVVQMKGSAYVPQLINMYAVTIGDWSRPLVAFIAFACMYGTTITVIDGYPRAIAEATRLVRGKPFFRTRELFAWILWVSISAVALILWFQGALGDGVHLGVEEAVTADATAVEHADGGHRLDPLVGLDRLDGVTTAPTDAEGPDALGVNTGIGADEIDHCPDVLDPVGRSIRLARCAARGALIGGVGGNGNEAVLGQLLGEPPHHMLHLRHRLRRRTAPLIEEDEATAYQISAIAAPPAPSTNH